ncbi:MAG: GNAT family N-acetyltransferase [Proteobacteria bacterium]|nr:GNAT family N-acetyltransferase [Pseudomonadota bacterium]
MNLNIRRAQRADLDDLAVLFDAYRQFYAQPSDVPAAHRFLEARMANSESVVFLGERDGDPAGFVQLYPLFSSVGMRRVWLLNDLFVAATARRSGLATKLLQSAHEMARADGASGVLLETHTGNRDAQALYEKLGYQRNKATWFYWLALGD